MGDSSTQKVKGTGKYVGPDTSNPFYQQLQSGGTYDPTGFMNQGNQYFQQGISALQGGVSDADYARARDQARQTAEGAYTMYGTSARDLAQRQSRAAQESVASELAGSGALNSGAALASIAEGTANPLLQAETNLAQLYGNAYTGTAGQLYGQYGQNLSNIASLYGQQGAGQYGLGGQALGLLGDYSQSQYIAPQYYQRQGVGDQLLGAGLGALSGFAGGFAGGLGGAAGASIFSDRNLKKDISEKKLSEGLANVKGYGFKYVDGDRQESGIMAQDLEKTGFKDAVVDTPIGKAIDTRRLTTMNTAVLAEHERRFEALEAMLKERMK